MANFKIKKITKFEDLEVEGIPTSDLCLSNNGLIYQFDYVTEDEIEKQVIKPGVFTLSAINGKLRLLTTQFKSNNLLESLINTKIILKEIKGFFKKLHIYDKYQVEKKRSILFYSPPGGGKSSALQKACTDLMEEDPGTVIIIWPTSSIDPEPAAQFFTFGTEEAPEVTRMILIIEDIGGGGMEDYSGPKNVSSDMLNFLDGVGVSFRLPTFIVATTNFPQNLITSLADRPGRFDQLIELAAPSSEERVQLYEFFVKRLATTEEVRILTDKSLKNLSVAHIKEIPIRMAIHDKTMETVVQEMLKHSEKVKNQFNKTEKMGF